MATKRHLYTTLTLLFLSVMANCNVSLKRECSNNPPASESDLREAYVTLLFGDFLLGVRVLGQSLEESGTKKERIVITASDVSQESQDILENDGWTVKPLVEIPNQYPDADGPKLSTKLVTWLLTQYRRLVFIDADAIVSSNVDELFRCGSFCVVYRHSDLFNTGVFVLKPSVVMYNSFHLLAPTLPLESQTDDQDILNFYYSNLRYGNMFNATNTSYCNNPMRLPAGYNGDIGVYYLNSRWKMPIEEVKITHYTLGPVKPWKWWAFTLFELNWKWNDLREKLACDTEPQLLTLRNWIPPLVLIIFLTFLWKFKLPVQHHDVGTYKPKPSRCYFSVHSILAKLLPLSILFTSSYMALCVVPTTMYPHHAVLSFCLWVTFIQFLMYCPFCYLAYRMRSKNGLHKIKSILNPKMESALWACVSVSLFLQVYYIPFFVNHFSFRVLIFLCLLVFSIVCHHLIGQRLIKVWFGHCEIGPNL